VRFFVGEARYREVFGDQIIRFLGGLD